MLSPYFPHHTFSRPRELVLSDGSCESVSTATLSLTRQVRIPVASYASLGITATSSTFAVFDRTTLGTTTTSTSSSPVDLSLTPLLPFSSGYQVPLSVFTLSTSTTVFASSPLLSSSTSYFPFDSSFSSATGTLTGTPVNNPTFGVGKVYQALVTASSSSQYVSLPNASVPWGSNTWSFNVWVKFNSAGGNQSVFMNARTGQGLMFYKSGTNIISVGKPNVSSADYTWSGIDTNWHMWTYVASSSQGGKLYLDGNPTPVATDVNTTALVNPAGDTLPVGAYTSSGALQSGWYGDATIDELGFFSVPLTTSDISSLYNGGVGRSLSSTSVASSSAASYVPLLDPAYDPLPSLPQGALPAISYPFATSSVSTSTLNTLTVATTTTTTTYTPFSGYSDSSSTVTTYITLNGTLVGTYSYQKGNEASSGKLTYTLTNYLGTPVLQADDKGDILEMDITDVFGNYVQRDQRKDGAYHNKGYTGHEFDDTAGLIYAHARYLSAPMHTFLSVDPMLYRIPQSYLYDPQQMNSYAYARNNPVVMMDPNGLSILSSIKSFIGSVVSLTKSALTATAKTVSNRVVEIATSQKTIGVINGATQQTADMGSSIMYLSAGAVNYASGGNCSTCVAMQQQLINSGPLIPTTNINTSSPTYQGALFVGSMFEPSSGGPEGVVEKAAAKQAAKILEASGLGSTAKKQITTLSESILMRAVKDNPLLGNLIPGMSPLKDSRWVGWLKYEFKTKTNNGEDIIIHYNVLKDEFGKLMAVDDFKLK